MYDTIIIGAGMSGLAAGIRLAHYERRVCILERHTTIGGLNSFYRLGGRDYDVGLHAVTNFQEKGAKKGPLPKLLRQLRFQWDDFALAPQVGSVVAFPGVELQFNNDFELLRSEVAREFPSQMNGFDRLCANLADYDQIDDEAYVGSAREHVRRFISDETLEEMIFCPLMWYGNGREHDMDIGQFCIMFRSIFLEGFARPYKGVRLILKHLVKRFRSLGGELKLRSGVDHIAVKDGQVEGVVLDGGEELSAKNVLSSAGRYETLKLCEDVSQVDAAMLGKLSFCEAISILDRQPKELGCDRTIVFYNDSPKFHWERPDDFCDVRTGVICSPNNYAYAGDEKLADGVMRITTLANFDRWKTLSEDGYKVQKNYWFDQMLESAVRFVPDFRHRVIDLDMFTPTTIRRFTWHDGGTVYGAPEKKLDGTTHLPNLFLCGTDQGYVGIVGSILSGISVANRYLLRD
jgi:phytoene dehydrogenase-like protein